MGSIDQILFQVSIWLLPALLAITLHEAAHGYVADMLGDDTARREGRISLNPLQHIDPFGTILLPGILLLSGSGFLFGYAKPVPVNFWRLRNPRRDMVWVAAAGPGINLAMALAAAFLYHGVGLLPDGVAQWAAANLRIAVTFNVFLAVFNMLPIPPLDGGRVAVGLLPDALARPLARLEPYGIFIVLGVAFLLPLLPGWSAGRRMPSSI
jgi:Zn-dependent protease